MWIKSLQEQNYDEVLFSLSLIHALFIFMILCIHNLN